MKRGIGVHEVRGMGLQLPDVLGMLTTGGTGFFGTANLYGEDGWDNQTWASTAANSNERLRAWPIPIPRPITVDALRISVATAADSGDHVRLGIYLSDGAENQPSTLLVDTGDVLIDTGGTKTATFTALTLLPGLYWFAMLTDYTGATNPEFRGENNPHASYHHDMDIVNNNTQDCVWERTGVVESLPDPFGTGTWVNRSLTYIQARAA
jgi:hypothetical protein